MSDTCKVCLDTAHKPGECVRCDCGVSEVITSEYVLEDMDWKSRKSSPDRHGDYR